MVIMCGELALNRICIMCLFFLFPDFEELNSFSGGCELEQVIIVFEIPLRENED